MFVVLLRHPNVNKWLAKLGKRVCTREITTHRVEWKFDDSNSVKIIRRHQFANAVEIAEQQLFDELGDESRFGGPLPDVSKSRGSQVRQMSKRGQGGRPIVLIGEVVFHIFTSWKFSQ